MRRIQALALVPLLALAACSAPAAPATTAAPATSAPATSVPATSAPATTTPSSDVSTTNDGSLAGDGYTLSLPEGWKDATADFKKIQPSVDAGAKDSADTDTFNDNVNVIVQSSPEIPMEQFKAAIKKQLEGAGSKNIEFKANAPLDGKTAMQVWSTTKGTDAHTIQFMAFTNAKIYVVTVSTNRPDSKAAALALQILGGWQWA